jgi:hypothetical protein
MTAIAGAGDSKLLNFSNLSFVIWSVVTSAYPLSRFPWHLAHKRYTISAQTDDTPPTKLRAFAWTKVNLLPSREFRLCERSRMFCHACQVLEPIVDAVSGYFSTHASNSFCPVLGPPNLDAGVQIHYMFHTQFVSEFTFFVRIAARVDVE